MWIWGLGFIGLKRSMRVKCMDLGVRVYRVCEVYVGFVGSGLDVVQQLLWVYVSG